MATDSDTDTDSPDWRRAADSLRRVADRVDSMKNPQSGLGTARDRHTHTTPMRGEPKELDEDELDQLYERGRYARPIVERPAKDSVRGGFTLKERDGEATLDDCKEVFAARARQLRLLEKIDEALVDARLTGGAGLMIVADDNAPKEEPIDWRTFTHIKAIQVVDRFDMTAADYVTDVTSEQFGQPETFWYHPDDTGGIARDPDGSGETYSGEEIHHSRVIPYFGRRVRSSGPDRFDGWAQPVLEGAIETIKDMAVVTQAMASSVHEFQFDVLKIDGLSDLISAHGMDGFEARMEAMALSRSYLNATALDANGEDLEMRTVDFSGPIEVLGLLKENLSLISDIPMSILFGQTPAGLSSNDETGRDNYFDSVRQIRARKHEPALQRIARILACERRSDYDVRTPDDDDMPRFGVQWEPLDEPTPQESAETDKAKAEAAGARASAIQGDVKLGILSPREAQKIRHPDTVDEAGELPGFAELDRKAQSEASDQQDGLHIDATDPNRPIKAGDGQPEKQRKRDVGYVNSAPSTTEECEGCGWYLGDRQCGIVRGKIAPTGWCRLWGTAAFAAGIDDEEDDDSDVPQTPNTGFGANQDSAETGDE